MFNLAVDPRERHTIWGVLFGYSWLWLSVFGVSQTQASVGADSDMYFLHAVACLALTPVSN